MSNSLGTLWFGADIDLTALKQKIQQGNKEVLDALKIDYDPQSYQQMVSKLKSRLASETFEIKLSANTNHISQNIQSAMKGGGGQTMIDDINKRILLAQERVNSLKSLAQYFLMNFVIQAHKRLFSAFHYSYRYTIIKYW